MTTALDADILPELPSNHHPTSNRRQ